MLGLLLYAVSALASSQTPYNFRLHESFLPQKVAQSLVESSISTSYEYYYIGNASYLCALPEHQQVVPETIPEPDAAVLASAVDSIQDSFSSDSCVWAYDLRRSYWTYAFCNGDKIIQYHEAAPIAERGKKHLAQDPDHVFVLGRFQKPTSNKVLFSNQASASSYKNYVNGEFKRTAILKDDQVSPFTHSPAPKVVSQVLTDGSVCDMTGQPRTIEVVYKCDGSLKSSKPQIIEVSEIRVCHYKMTMHVPNLCSNEAFLSNTNLPSHLVDINCQRVASSDFMENSVFGKEKAAKRRIEKEKIKDVFEQKVEGVAKEKDEEKKIDDLEERNSDLFERFFGHTVFRDHAYFPVRADHHINIADHHLAPLNRGFYIARSKVNPESESEYFNHRNVILFNGFHDSLSDLNMQFAQAIINSIGTKLLAPIMQQTGAGEPVLSTMLDWRHTFVLFFEIYDYKGEFLGLAKISHDASRGKKAISASVFNSTTLLDNEGDIADLVPFKRPHFDAPVDMWNFQVFDEDGRPLTSNDLGSSKGLKESRLLVAYNRGWEKNKVKMEVVDETSGSVLPGAYTADNEYSFVLESVPGQAIEFKIKPIQAYQEFYGFKVDVPVKPVDAKKSENSKDVPKDPTSFEVPNESDVPKDSDDSEDVTIDLAELVDLVDPEDLVDLVDSGSDQLREVIRRIVEEIEKVQEKKVEEEVMVEEKKKKDEKKKDEKELPEIPGKKDGDHVMDEL